MNGYETFGAALPRMNRVRLLLWLLAMAAMSNMALPAYAADGPTVPRTSVQVSLWRQQGYWAKGAKQADFSTTCWMPQTKFTVMGPVPGGSQFFVDFTKPDGSLWLHVDCLTKEIPEGEQYNVTTPRDTSTAAEKKFTTGVGVFGFKIRLKNELSGQNLVLFSGKYKVGRISKAIGNRDAKNRGEFYVNHDWALPIGYVALYNPYETSTPPKLTVWLWLKGQNYGSDLAGYVFYKGKQIASTKDEGKGTTVESEVEMTTVGNDKGDPTWIQWSFTWGVIGSNPNADKESPYFVLDKNPGEYSVKVLRGGKLCRETKFTVGEDGKIVDTGIAAANHMVHDGIILPVKVLGTTDGLWDKTAWQTSAFYGNPLKGFVAP